MITIEVLYHEREELQKQLEELRTATTRTEGAIIYVSQKIQELEREQTQGDAGTEEVENIAPDEDI